MEFWHIQMNLGLKSDERYSFDQVQQILQKNAIIGTGEWKDNKDDQCERFKSELQVGDIVLVRDGSSPIALVEIAGPNTDKGSHYWNERPITLLALYENYEPLIGSYEGQAQGTLTYVKNRHNSTGSFIIRWHELYMKHRKIDKLTALLRGKHQIILQGPPGTGKTYLAKQLAKQLTYQPGSVDTIMEGFLQYASQQPDRLQQLTDKQTQLLGEFQATFPIDKLDQLSLESYSIGTGRQDNFCWWIEIGLKDLGTYSPSRARSYLIYWSKKDQAYSLHGRLLEDIADPEEGMRKLAGIIHSLVQKMEYSTTRAYLGESLMLKILHSYFPEEFFPINSNKHLDRALRLLGISISKKADGVEKNQALQSFFRQQKTTLDFPWTNQHFMAYLYDTYRSELKGEKEIVAEGGSKQGAFQLIQFHPAYTYEDFVRGISTESDEEGGIRYTVQNRILGEFAAKAWKNHQDSKKPVEELAQETPVEDWMKEFSEQIQEKISDGNMVQLSEKVYLERVGDKAFYYTGDNWKNTLSMPFTEILKLYQAEVETWKEIKEVPGIRSITKDHATYYFSLLEQFKAFVAEREQEQLPTSNSPAVTEQTFVLIIDEINRANLPAVLGELIYALEYRGEAVESMYDHPETGRSLILPPNLLIIGTMNTADRSVGHIDYAIRRRFAFVDMPPDESVITFAPAKTLFQAVAAIFEEYLSSDFQKEEVQIGHSYFLVNDRDALQLKLTYEIQPILREYMRDGVLQTSARGAIETLSLDA